VRQSYKTFFLWAVLILLFFSFYSIFSRQRSAEPKEIDEGFEPRLGCLTDGPSMQCNVQRLQMQPNGAKFGAKR